MHFKNFDPSVCKAPVVLQTDSYTKKKKKQEFSSTPINFDSDKPVQGTDHLTHGLVITLKSY